ncbi:MAG: DUF4390 domain-containing protein [Thermoanaerobaculales bacterium]|jgi:hypothetical protein|nr:DUF4390 domain-containing protein [Thermoanaerobaculales bacterium]
MPGALLLALVAAAAAQSDPMTLAAIREPAAVEVSFGLEAPLPDELDDSLAAGAEVRLVYPLRVKAKRRGLWDHRVWSGELVSIVGFDPVTGRYRCQVILDGIITSTGEVDTAEAARRWLVRPPPVRVELPEERRRLPLKVRVRAVFSSGTTWLVFPTHEATPWVELAVEPLSEPVAAD